MKNFYIKIYGCLFNHADAQRIKTILLHHGLKEVLDPKRAHIIIVISCSVRQKAEHKAIDFINKFSQNKITILTGCMIRRDFQNNMTHNTQKRIKYLNEILPRTYFIDITNIKLLPKMLNDIENKTKKHIIDKTYTLNTREPNYYDIIAPTYDNDSPIAAIPIMSGCNEMCSYCVVPYSRGQEYYRNLDSILQDVYKALSNGKKIIYLLGQIVDKWEEANRNFLFLLKSIVKIKKTFYLGFTSPHPNYITRDIIDFIAKEPKMLKHLGLPLQSGSNKILKLMNRKYTVEKYKKIAQYAKNKIPNLYLTTDIIVGFPGETGKDFNQTVNIIKELRFDKIFFAKYSPRLNEYHKKIVNNSEYQKILTKRFNRINKIANLIFSQNNQQRVGSVYKAIIINSKFALTETNQYVEIEPSQQQLQMGKLIQIKITKGGTRGLAGKILKML